MSIKYLGLDEMAGITRVWTYDMRGVLMSIPQLAGWVQSIDEVHVNAVKAQPARSEMLDEIASISAQQAAIDERFDDCGRVASLVLEAEVFHCRLALPDRAVSCKKARRLIFPDGLNVINASYVAEAGHADRVASLLATETWLPVLLASIPLSGETNVLELIKYWCSLGVQLTALESKKLTLQGKASEVPAPTRQQIMNARNDWLRVVGTVIASFDAIKGHDGALVSLRKPVEHASDLAAKRRASGKADETEFGEACPAQAAAASASTSLQAAGAAFAQAAAEIPPGFPGAKPYI